ncbi:DUF5906 domain-containing protein [Neobacillus sp. MER 74]|uniref:DUF5906 domain-containing protein n=1 Tax=Neobacillus sp. MER 74 TaxID=2939566 RepID=UPI00203D3FF0|nr:DUF5906 domain-containing protein [Neobacillus sp. MER 74]MCM3116843.1 DUF5906 domain-containing protein [Neobacillus sp. MER 74]
MKASEAAAYVEYLDGEKYATKNADIADTPDFFKDAGKKLRDDEVVVDIDKLPKDVIKKMISFFNIKTEICWTDRGIHMWFKKPKGYKHKAEGICALGFEVEWKVSKKTESVTVKRNGVLRPVENKDEREELPDFLTYFKKAENLLGLQEHDGRDNKLFAHTSKVLHLKDSKKILRFINDYVFAEPLEEKDFDRITRDRKVEPEKGNEFEIARYLIKKLKVTKFGGNLYIFDGQKFISINDDDFIPIVTQEVLGQTTRYIDEVIKQMKYQLFNKNTPENGWHIKFQNGFLKKGRFWELDSQEFTPYFINLKYDKNAEPVPIVDEYLDFLTEGDESYKNLIMEALAHILITDPDLKRMLAKFFIIIGNGGNGKGTLLTVIRKIIGTENCSSLSIEDMTKEQYFFSMQGKLVNLGDDIHDVPINHKQMKVLKNTSTCDFQATRQLFKHSKDTVITTSLIFTSNHQLKSFEKTEAYKRRVSWCPIFGVPTKPDPKLIAKLTTKEAKEYWLKLIIEAYIRLYENCDFTECKKVQEYNEEYHEMNNSCLIYVSSLTKDDFIMMHPKEAYDKYKIWSDINYGEDSAQSTRVFQETVKKEFDLEIIVKRKQIGTSKEPTRVYVTKKEAEAIKKKKEEKKKEED